MKKHSKDSYMKRTKSLRVRNRDRHSKKISLEEHATKEHQYIG
jgi:hypothetical protein